MVVKVPSGDGRYWYLRPTATVVCVHVIIDSKRSPSLINRTVSVDVKHDEQKKNPSLVVVRVPSGGGRCWWPYCLQL